MIRRKTEQLIRVAIAMMSDPFGRHYGYGLSMQARVRPAVMYPILDRMLEDGWVTDYWESPDEVTAKRPRRYYVLTDKGRVALGALQREAVADPRFVHLNATEA